MNVLERIKIISRKDVRTDRIFVLHDLKLRTRMLLGQNSVPFLLVIWPISQNEFYILFRQLMMIGLILDKSNFFLRFHIITKIFTPIAPVALRDSNCKKMSLWRCVIVYMFIVYINIFFLFPEPFIIVI